MGTVTVDDSRYALTTQEYRLAPLRSVTIRGRAVPTTVWSREARNKVSRIAPRIASFVRGGRVINEGAAVLAKSCYALDSRAAADFAKRSLAASTMMSTHASRDIAVLSRTRS